MKLYSINVTHSPLNRNSLRLSGEVSYDTPQLSPEVYWIDIPKQYERFIADSGNPWIACLMPLAMTLGEPLQISRPVDKTLYENIQKQMHIWKSWYPKLTVIPIEADTVSGVVPDEAQKNCAFFSGGVDAFYTVLTRQNGDALSVDELIHVWGFDIPIHHQSAYENMIQGLRSVSQELNKGLIEIATNIRKTKLEQAQWGPFYHGAALAFVGLCLEKRYRNLLIASTFAHHDIHPWGSNHLTDPLFSTSVLKVWNDGNCPRSEKIARICNSEIAQRHLHVCFMQGTEKNCCHCIKCYRTMINIELHGFLSCFKTFQDPVHINKVKKIFSYDRFDRDVLQNLRTIALQKCRGDIAQAIEESFFHTDRVYPFWELADRLKKNPKAYKVARLIEETVLKDTLF